MDLEKDLFRKNRPLLNMERIFSMLDHFDLLKKVKQKGIIVPFDSAKVGQGTIKLTLHKNIQLYVSDKPIQSDNEFPEENYKTIDILYKEFYLKPGRSALIKTAETVRIPHNMNARVYDRMHTELFGLTVNPREYIGPGHTGPVTALIVNHGPVPIRLVPGIQICQLSLHQLSIKKVRKQKKQLKTIYVIVNSILTALIAYGVNLTNWPMVIGLSLVSVIINITYTLWRDD